MLKDKSGKKVRTPELKKFETKVKTHVGPSVGVIVSRSNFVTNMNSSKKRHVQTHDFDLGADEDWVTFIDSGGWSGEQV